MSTTYDLIVIGEGMTGLTCAHHAASLGLRTATTEGNLFGGLIINIMELEGYEGGGSGVDIASAMMEKNAEAGIENLGATATSIEKLGDGFKVITEGGEHTARAVVVASGARLGKLGVPGEEQFDHRGVSQCADCDGPMFQGEHVVVVGGGDSAFQEALALTHYAGKVSILLRGDKPRARPSFVESAASNDKISVIGGSQVEEILGGDTVTGIKVRNQTGGISQMDCAGVFVFVGLTPNSEMAPADVARDARGAIETDGNYQTNVRGVFAAGAVRSGYSGQLVDAVAEARAAAESAAKMLAG